MPGASPLPIAIDICPKLMTNANRDKYLSIIIDPYQSISVKIRRPFSASGFLLTFISFGDYPELLNNDTQWHTTYNLPARINHPGGGVRAGGSRGFHIYNNRVGITFRHVIFHIHNVNFCLHFRA